MTKFKTNLNHPIMRSFIPAILLLALCPSVYNQETDYFPQSTLVGNIVSSDTSTLDAFNNPASVAFVQHNRISATFQNKYLMSELASKTLCYYLPHSYLNTAFQLNTNGYSVFHTLMYGISLARKYSQNLALGFQFSGFSVYQYNNHAYLTQLFWQLGLIVIPRSAFLLGCYFNKNIDTNSLEKQILPSYLSLGAEYAAGNKTKLLFQLRIHSKGQMIVSSGLNYSFNERNKVGIGLSYTDFLTNDFSFHHLWNKYSFGSRFILHPILGLTVVSSLNYTF